MDLSKASIQELKVAAYDQIALIEQSQNNLKLLNERIFNLGRAGEVVEPKEGSKEELKEDK